MEMKEKYNGHVELGVAGEENVRINTETSGVGGSGETVLGRKVAEVKMPVRRTRWRHPEAISLSSEDR